MYGTSTLRSIRSTVSSVMMPGQGRRPRQILAPSAAPPPPPPVIFLPGIDESDSKVAAGVKSGGGSKKHNTSGGGGSHLDDASSVMTGPSTGHPGGRRPSNSVFNFPIHPGGRPMAMGPGYGGPPPPGMGYPFLPGRGPMPAGPGAILVPMPVPTANGKKSKFGSLGSAATRGGGKFKLPKSSSKALKQQLLAQQAAVAAGVAGPLPPPPPGHMMGHMFIPPPPPVMAPPMALGVPVPMMAPPLSMRRQSGTSMEEPIYMPSQVRPLSPIASYAPAHFPHEAYLMQQHYAPGGGPMGPYGPMGFVPMPPGSMAGTLTKPGKKDKKLSKKEKKLQQQQQQLEMAHHHHLHSNQLAIMDGMSIQAEEDEEEVSISSQTGNNGGGIYRKGHLNERAFSYSIRQVLQWPR